MKKSEQGLGHMLAIGMLVIIIGVAGYVGYVVKNKNKPAAKTSSPSNIATSTVKAKVEVWKAGDSAVKGTYADADIVKLNDTTYRMYYAIQPEVKGNNFEVYSSTSTDGKVWTQDPGTRKTHATFPSVVKTSDGKYRMYFQAAGVLKSAISTDGLTFTDESGTRIDTENSAALTFDNVAAPTVTLKDDDSYVMIYRGTINSRYASNTPNPTTQVLMWATSTDGLTFTKKGLAVDSRNSTLNGQLDGPSIVKWDDGKYRVFATTYTGVYYFTFDGSSFGSATLAFAGDATQDSTGFHGAPPGDPTLAKIGGTWYMYYGTTNGINYATLSLE